MADKFILIPKQLAVLAAGFNLPVESLAKLVLDEFCRTSPTVIKVPFRKVVRPSRDKAG